MGWLTGISCFFVVIGFLNGFIPIILYVESTQKIENNEPNEYNFEI